MTRTAVAAPAPRLAVRRVPGADWGAAGAWLLGVSTVTYLGMRGGAYDALLRGQAGVALWWIVLVGAVSAVLPFGRLPTAAWGGVGLLAGFTAWATASAIWSESAERSIAEGGRVATLLAVLVLGLGSQGRRELARPLIAGVAAGAALVALAAVLSRIHPDWFPQPAVERALEHRTDRLSYPLNYWNGDAALSALALPLLLALSLHARTLAGQVLSLAAVPILSLCIFYTASRGGVLYALIGIAALMALAPGRLALLPPLGIAAIGSAVLLVGADDRNALQANLGTALAQAQGAAMLRLLVATCAGVALLGAAYGLLRRSVAGPAWLRIDRRSAAALAAGGVVLALVVAVALGAPAAAQREWGAFKAPLKTQPGAQTESGVGRLRQSFSGNGRYQFWQAAARAGDRAPIHGIGAGTFELWWSRKATTKIFVRDAHSLYLETYGELGIAGVALLVAFLALVLGTGLVEALRPGDLSHRALIAAATAAGAVFVTAAAVDWVWELTVIPVAFLLLAAVTLSTGRRPARLPAPRLAAAVLAVGGLVVVTIPLTAVTSVRASEQRAARGDIAGALGEAATARAVEPYAASPRLQQALVLEQAGRLAAAAAAGRGAVAREPTGWQGWLTLSRLEARAGDARAAVSAYRRARALNRLSPLFR